MRDYPSVPNVFRVASSQSVNSEDNFLLSMSASKGPTAHVGKGNAAMIAEQTAAPKDYAPKHQQQRQSMQQQAGFENDAVQPRSATMPPIASQQEPQLQRHFLHLAAPMAPMFSNKSAQRQNTTLSMERPTCRNGGVGHQEQYSPYGTLPRFLQGVSNGDLHKQQQRQQLSNDATVSGLINTISGSIPSTGVGVDSRATFKRNEPNGNIRSSESGIVNKACNMRNQQQRPCVKYCSSRAERQNGAYLWILTPVAASISVAIVVAALAGPQWLFTEEKLPNTNYNGTANFNVLDDGAFITKYTKSSLWILCSTLQGVDTYNCIKIDYFPKEGYQPDPHDSTPAIPYTVTRSCPFFLVAGLCLLVSFIVFLIPTCSQQSSLYYFSAGIMFIVSGLLMLIGLIVYISILKAEIGSKLRPRSTLQPALFKVTYGQSFFLFVFGFIATEFVGLMNIFLYISLQEVDYYSHFPCFAISNLQKLKEGARLKHELSSDLKAPPASRYGNKRHQVHDAGFPASLKPEVASDEKTLFQQVTSHVCRKHPNAAASNFLMEEDLKQRYYFEKPPLMSKCYLHSKNLAKSLNELYTEPALPVGPPPPPSTIKMGAARTLPRLQQDPSRFGSVHQEFPLTRSVSTTTDLYTNDGQRSASNNLKTSSLHVERRNCRNMATNTQLSGIEIARREKELVRGQQLSDLTCDYDMEPPQRLCGLKRGTVRKTKEELFHEFCKRSGVRPKPKNIYYISNEEEGFKGSKGRERTDGTEALELNANGNETRACREVQYDAECKQLLLQDDEEHIYVVDDNPNYLLADPSRNMRRASMYVEPAHIRKLSSDLSLQTLYAPETSHKISLLELEKCAHNRNAFGGSEDRLCQAYNAQINASRTLPHTFNRRSTDSLDSMGSASLQASTHALQSAYCVSRNRLSSLMLQHQQQQRQYLQQKQQPRVVSLHHSSLALNRTSEHPGTYASVACSQHQQPPATTQLASCSQDSSKQPASVQWPAVIPSSPSAFASRYQMYAPMPDAHMHPHSLLTRSTSGGSKNAAIDGMAQPKFQRGYAFDEQRRSSSIVVEAFDLDEIERERKCSHASLFSGTSFSAIGACNSNNNAENYDLINGTAV